MTDIILVSSERYGVSLTDVTGSLITRPIISRKHLTIEQCCNAMLKLIFEREEAFWFVDLICRPTIPVTTGPYLIMTCRGLSDVICTSCTIIIIN